MGRDSISIRFLGGGGGGGAMVISYMKRKKKMNGIVCGSCSSYGMRIWTIVL